MVPGEIVAGLSFIVPALVVFHLSESLWGFPRVIYLSFIRGMVMFTHFFARFAHPAGARRLGKSPRTRLILQSLENRITPATATLSVGVLTIDYTATGTTSERVYITDGATSITLNGNVTGDTVIPTNGLNRIVVLDSGGGSNQEFSTQAMWPMMLGNGFSSVGVEEVWISSSIQTFGSSNISIIAPKFIVVSNAALVAELGDVTLKANLQSTPSSGQFSGIGLSKATIMSISGAISLEGRGGNYVSGGQCGILVSVGTIVGKGTTGPVTIIGTGGSTKGGENDGVMVDGGLITSGGGPVTVNGFGGGTGSSWGNAGVRVASAGQISAGGTGKVAVQGTGGNGSLSAGVFVTDIGSQITSSGGTVSVIGKGTSTIGANGVTIRTSGTITGGGAGAVNVQGAGASSGGDNLGIDILSSGKITSSGGPVAVSGQGGGGGGSYGVSIIAGLITAGGVGTVTVSGTASNGAGIRLLSDGNITSSGGAVSVTGQGGTANGRNEGVTINGSQISAGGFGSVTIQGTGGKSNISNDGVYVSGGTVTSDGGPVVINGTGGTGSGSVGVKLLSSQITSGGTGTITVQGIGGSGTGTSHYGVCLGATSVINSAGGAITVSGVGGPGGLGVGVYSASESQIKAGGNGAIYIHGQGASSSGYSNDGMHVYGEIASSGGAVSLLGEGRGTIFGSDGVYIGDGGLVSAGGLGTVSVVGIRGPSGAGDGVSISNGSITSSGGDISLQGTGNNGLAFISSGSISSGGVGNLTINSTGEINLISGQIKSGGNITINSTGPIYQSSGSNSVSTIQAPNGTLSLNAPGQTATFQSLSNIAAQLVIPANVTCLVNGLFDATGAVQVDGTLGGSGSVGTVTVMSTGRIAPGNSPGKISTSNIVLNSNSVLGVELNGPSAGSDYDQLAVTGTINLGGATLQVSLGFVPSTNQVFTIIDNDTNADTVTGTFNGYAEGATVTIGAVNFTISYVGGDGNDVTLTRQVAVPPPTVTSVTLSDGTGLPVTHRSHVRQIIVEFSEAVTFSGSVASAFTVHRAGTSTINGNPIGDVQLIASPATGPASTVTITFDSANVTFVESGGTISQPLKSLRDGIYNFTIDASKITGAGGNLDGDLVGGAGGNYTVIGSISNGWYRLFGDSNGDGAVNQVDFIAAVANTSPSIFDFDNDGQVSQFDYNAFRLRFLNSP